LTDLVLTSREQLCPKFTTQSDCHWISSGDLSWKEKLSDDLDKVFFSHFSPFFPIPWMEKLLGDLDKTLAIL